VGTWLEGRPASARWPLRFVYVMVSGRASLVYMPLAVAFFIAWWENGRLLWYFAFFGPTWLGAVEVGVPVAQAVTALVAVSALVYAGARVGWAERARRLKETEGTRAPAGL